MDALRSGSDTIMFCAAIGDDGRMLAGLRAKGPLRSADDSHAVAEWEGQPGQQMVRDMITDRIPFGVLEIKSGWVIDDSNAGRSLTTALSRSGFYMASLTGFRVFHGHRCRVRDQPLEVVGWFSGTHPRDAIP